MLHIGTIAIIVLNVSANAETLSARILKFISRMATGLHVIMDGDKVKSVTVRNEDETEPEAVFYIPNMSKGFVWSGDLKINQFYAEDKDGLDSYMDRF